MSSQLDASRPCLSVFLRVVETTLVACPVSDITDRLQLHTALQASAPVVFVSAITEASTNLLW